MRQRRTLIFCEDHDSLRVEGELFFGGEFPEYSIKSFAAFGSALHSVRENVEHVAAIVTDILGIGGNGIDFIHQCRALGYEGPAFYSSSSDLSLAEKALFNGGVKRGEHSLDTLIQMIQEFYGAPQRVDKRDVANTIAYRIVSAREALGYSVPELAAHLADGWGISPASAATFIHRIEEGKSLLQLPILPEREYIPRKQRIADYLSALGIAGVDQFRILEGISNLKPSFSPPESAVNPYVRQPRPTSTGHIGV